MKKIFLFCLFLSSFLFVKADGVRYEMELNIVLHSGEEIEAYSEISEFILLDSIHSADYVKNRLFSYQGQLELYSCRVVYECDSSVTGNRMKLYLLDGLFYIPEQEVKDVKVTGMEIVSPHYFLENTITCEDEDWIKEKPIAFYRFNTQELFSFYVFVYQDTPQVRELIQKLEELQVRYEVESGRLTDFDELLDLDNLYAGEFHKLILSFRGEKVIVVTEVS